MYLYYNCGIFTLFRNKKQFSSYYDMLNPHGHDACIKLKISVKFIFLLALALIIWAMSCAKVGPGYQTEHGWVAARVNVNWTGIGQCFGGA